MIDEDIFFMKKAITLAEKARGYTYPNPLVGAVLVKEGSIIGEGYHSKYGNPHAEYVAIIAAKSNTKNSTMYVTVEPCVHFGKTPPCVDKIIKAGIKRVVIGMKDPNPRVNGKGIERLRKAGIKVKTGVLEKEILKQNEAYVKFIQKSIPFVVVKIAMSIDGKIALSSGESRWITQEKARVFAHKLRSESQAVLVGINTVLKDDPLLDARLVKGRDPIKVVLDAFLQIPENARLLNKGKTLIFTKEDTKISKKLRNAEIIKVKALNGFLSLSEILKELGRKKVVQLLVEGGGTVISSFLKERLVDKIIFIINPSIIGNGIDFAKDLKIKDLNKRIRLQNVEMRRINEDIIVEGYPVYRYN